MSNRDLDTILGYLQTADIPYRIEHGKHIKVYGPTAGATRLLAVVSNTPSDHRSAMNTRSQLRRKLRELGLETDH